MWRAVLYVNPVSVALFVLAMLAFSFLGSWWLHRRPGTALRMAKVLLYAWGVVILVATLMPTQPLGSSDHHIWWLPGEGLWGGQADGLFPEERTMIVRLQVANAAMFVPFGSSLAFVLTGTRRAPLAWASFACFAFSVAIEAAQFVMAAGRTVDADDVLFNTFGGFVGAGVALIGFNLFAVSQKGAGKHRQPLPTTD